MPISTALLAFVYVSLAAAPEGRTLASLFEAAPQAEVTASGMTVVHEPQHHVLVARIADDGQLSTSCAVTEEAVEALLRTPVVSATDGQTSTEQ